MKIAVIAPNISENLSGEAIKAHQYVRYLTTLGADLTVVAHARSRGHFEDAAQGAEVVIIEDDWLQKFLWRSGVFRPFVTLPFFWSVRSVVKRLYADNPSTAFHYLCPVSPIYPRLPVKGARNILGPLTGNIYYPPAFRAREPFTHALRRRIHKLSQWIVGAFVRDKPLYERILVSGGARTRESLTWAGAQPAQFADVVDSGINEKILSLPPIEHQGANYRFVCNGRLVPHKGVDLAIRAVARAQTPVTLDIFGKGPEAEPLARLIEELGLQDRVAMRGWLASHDELIEEMRRFRGFVFPSLAEANGIVVQEALAMGLPVICLDWGGPAVLTTDETARRIAPTGPDAVVDALAAEMDRLAEDPDLANQRAKAGLDDARARFGWSAVAEQWIATFR